jgi:glutamine amidotransferase
MGWNCHRQFNNSPLFKGVSKNDDVYFVHSYYCELSENTIAECDYILPFSAAMQKENFYATQFHPEKSASVGERILKNFLKL